MRKNTMTGLLLAVALVLPLTACQDTKARQENVELKAHVDQLVKDNGNLGNQVDTLTQENAALKQENERLKARKTPAKGSKGKHHHHRQAAATQN